MSIPKKNICDHCEVSEVKDSYDGTITWCQSCLKEDRELLVLANINAYSIPSIESIVVGKYSDGYSWSTSAPKVKAIPKKKMRTDLCDRCQVATVRNHTKESVYWCVSCVKEDQEYLDANDLPFECDSSGYSWGLDTNVAKVKGRRKPAIEAPVVMQIFAPCDHCGATIDITELSKQGMTVY